MRRLAAALALGLGACGGADRNPVVPDPSAPVVVPTAPPPVIAPPTPTPTPQCPDRPLQVTGLTDGGEGEHRTRAHR